MKIESYKYPKSSFLSVDKDISSIASMILLNNNLKKLLYYTTPDALSKPAITEDLALKLFKRNIKTIPKRRADPDILNYIVITMDNFTPSSNPQFRDNIVELDVLCHFDLWQLDDSKLRPYRIVAELDTMLNEAKLSGIGTLQFLGTNELVLNDEIAGLCLTYIATHGGDDLVNPLNPADEAMLNDNFDEIYNQ